MNDSQKNKEEASNDILNLIIHDEYLKGSLQAEMYVRIPNEARRV